MSLIETEMNTGVLTVTLNDPENRNTLSSELTFELVETLDAADNDPEVRVIVLTTPEEFSAQALTYRNGPKETNLQSQ